MTENTRNEMLIIEIRVPDKEVEQEDVALIELQEKFLKDLSAIRSSKSRNEIVQHMQMFKLHLGESYAVAYQAMRKCLRELEHTQE
jgi:hypothetical protein